jgi:transposase
MKEDSVTLNGREQRRLLVLNQLGSGYLASDQAAGLLGISERQLRRLRRSYGEKGAKALAHGNRGRAPGNAITPQVRRQIVTLATSRYQGFNQQHLTEMLAEHEHLRLSRPTVHRILKAAGVASPRQRRARRVHRRRDRFPRAGMLLQIDASRHDWLEGRGPYLSLVGAIDDATGLVPWACFRAQEDAEGYFDVLRQTVQHQGVPLAVYADRHGIFFRTASPRLSLEEQFDGRRRPTQFGRLLDELGIQLILARSPQAKGRVERLWGTFQDRLASELRLARATTRDEAQAVLTGYLRRHNRRFMVPPNDPQPAWQPAPDRRRFDQLFCFKYRRLVANDHTIAFGHQRIDIPPGGPRRNYAGGTVEVHQRFDGTLAVYYDGTCLTKTKLEPHQPDQRAAWYRGPARPRVPPAFTPPPAPAAKLSPAPRPPQRPPANHPWRRYFPFEARGPKVRRSK